MTVGERIKEIRMKLGMSQVDFANKINVSKQTLYKYENNIITNIPSDKIAAAADLGNVSPSYIMGWKEIDSRFSGKEASNDIYAKFTQNIEMHHGKTNELLKIYNQLSSKNKDKTILYSKNLLSLQQMDEELKTDAAHARTDLSTNSDGQVHDDNIMDNDSEWE